MKVTVKGLGRIVMLGEVEDDDMREYNVIISGVEVFADSEDITKKKGKYIKSSPFANAMKDMGVSPYSILCQMSSKDNIEIETEFEIPVSKEEFDPKKLQLIKSDYEFLEIPYCIMTDRIIYNEKEYFTISDLIDYGFIDFEEMEYNG
ncbi:MAG: hypothetical protein J1E16_06430 [Muribaculaceae bacterium]|nr:hypothetical protein [Muribaculaceae bacterium]